MKSIEEFSVEYAQDKYLPVQTSQAVKAGANYVLEQIESACMNGVYAKDKYRNVLNVLEQLKNRF